MARTIKKREPLTEETSCRLSRQQKQRLLLAARKVGVKPSHFMRDAVVSKCESVLGRGQNLLEELADIIGAVNVPTDVARDIKQVFGDIVMEKHTRNRRTFK